MEDRNQKLDNGFKIGGGICCSFHQDGSQGFLSCFLITAQDRSGSGIFWSSALQASDSVARPTVPEVRTA